MKFFTLIVLSLVFVDCIAQIPNVRKKYKEIQIETPSLMIDRAQLEEYLKQFQDSLAINSSRDLQEHIAMLLSIPDALDKQEAEQLRDLYVLNNLVTFNEEGAFLNVENDISVKQIEALANAYQSDFSFWATKAVRSDPVLINSLAIPYYEQEVEELKSQLTLLEQEKNNVTTLAELEGLSENIEIKREAIKDAKASLWKVKKSHFFKESFFPTTGAGRALAFESIYSKESDKHLYTGNEATIQFSDDDGGATIETELVSAYLGAFRLSFGSVLSSGGDQLNPSETSEETAEEVDDTDAFQRLLSKGGNTYLEVVYPLHYYQSKRAFTYVYVGAKAAVEIAEFNSDVDTSNGNASIFGDLYYGLSTDDEKFELFANLNYGIYLGGGDFYKRLAVADEKAFGFGSLTAGVTILKDFRFAITFNTFSSEEHLRSGNIVIGAQILSSMFEDKK